MPKLKVGMDAYFTTLGMSDRRRYGKLRKIIPTPDVVNNVVLYNSLFDVENPDGDLLTQMSAQVFFVIAGARNVPLVPVTALHPALGPRAAPEQTTADAQGAAAPGQQRPRVQGGNGTNADPGAAGAPPAGGRGMRLRERVASGTAPVRYQVHVMQDGEMVTRDVEIGVMNRMLAEVKSGLQPGDEVVLDGGVQGRQRQGQQDNQRGPGGWFGGPGGGGPRI